MDVRFKGKTYKYTLRREIVAAYLSFEFVF